MNDKTKSSWHKRELGVARTQNEDLADVQAFYQANQTRTAFLAHGWTACVLENKLLQVLVSLQDFKEAARLSAEAKKLASCAEADQSESKALTRQAADIEGKKQMCVEKLAVLQKAASTAERKVGEASRQLLQVQPKMAQN